MRIAAMLMLGILGLAGCQKAKREVPIVASELPAEIVRFRDEILGMDGTQVLAAVRLRFGKESRDLGSGFSIPEWDVAGGRLTIHPVTGAWFKDAAGVSVYLIPSENPAGDTLFQTFRMTSQHPSFPDTQVWIGNLDVQRGGTYVFSDSETNRGQRRSVRNNFFMRHPAGTVRVLRWRQGMDERALLEDAGDGLIAVLEFTPFDGTGLLQCAVVSSVSKRTLAMEDKEFRLSAGWRQTGWKVRK